MKIIFRLLFLAICYVSSSQNVTVDSQTYTPQQLIEDILIDSDCIANVSVTNVVGGDFSGTDQSYGVFNAAGTSFPFESGIVLSTGRLNNVQGPNTSLSDDDAPGWIGDSELEEILNETNTTNATILEFDFTAVADEISFRYLFASEEYQEGNPNTCNFSDLFGFLIRPISSQQYQNIAVVPGTQTPVKVTTVHPDIPGGCPAINEAYFESWNATTAPINFNGQTAILTAVAQTIPNQEYHVKLVIADEQNFRYDSAVFLEAGSFQLSSNLGENRILENQNPLCGSETLELNAFQSGNNSYKWFKDGIELPLETNAIYTVTEAGVYNVEVTLDNSCIAYGIVEIDYANIPDVFNTSIIACDDNQDGLTIYNLFDAQPAVTNNDQSLEIINFFISQTDAELNINPILEPTFFENTLPFQTVYAVVQNQFGCSAIAEIVLENSANTLNISDFEACDDESLDGFSSFNLNDLRTSIQALVPENATITFYESLDDSFAETNAISSNYNNTIPFEQEIYVKVSTEDNECYALTSVLLKVKQTPLLQADDTIFYCLNAFPNTLRLEGGIMNDLPNNYYYQWFKDGVDTLVDTSFLDINDAGTYQVIVTATNGCASSRTITVNPSETAIIEDIIINNSSASNTTVTVIISGQGIYAYQLDDGLFQTNNVFQNVAKGLHTITVRDIKNNCGEVQTTITILGIPKFFTPNGDSVNDVWKPYGRSGLTNAIKDITIFNRSGKLMANLTPSNQTWDGTFDGNALPRDDYWFIVVFNDGSQRTGHFALVR
jgi:gliding motility-associated-like protein